MSTTAAEPIARANPAGAAQDAPTRVADCRAGESAFVAALAVLFVAGAAATVVLCRSMSAMGGMAMPGGWTMSMAWMRMPGQTWLSCAGSFVGMWDTMMIPMMLPSLIPHLLRYRRAARETAGAPADLLPGLVGAGYFFVWTAIGAGVFAAGFALAGVEMQYSGIARMAPGAATALVATAGALQFTNWKAHRLACCRETAGPRHIFPACAGGSWRNGLRIGVQCAACCFGLMAIVPVAGIMDLRAMAAVTAAITAERVLPNGRRAARIVGAVAILACALRVAHGLGH